MKKPVREALPATMQWQSVPALVGNTRTESLVANVATEDQCREVLAFCRRNDMTLCLRGSGHSYGDLALNDGQVLLNTTGMDRILEFDEAGGTLRVQGGVKIIDIYRHVHARGYALPASPTESIITVAGAVAANVNGKDAWRVGNFCDQVMSIELMTAAGERRTVHPTRDRDHFLAVVGGMGLLGIVLEVTLRLRRVPSPFLEIARRPVPNVDALLTAMQQVEADSDFAVVWVDTCARGHKLGRSVIHATRWVERPATAQQRQAEVTAGLQRLARRRRQALALFHAFGFLFALLLEGQRITVRFFNGLYYAFSRLRCRLGTADNQEMFLRYNFDTSFTVPPVAVVCGAQGFTIQVSFPREQARRAIVDLIAICQASPCPPVTTILRIHQRDDHLISFCEDGYSLNFEFHPKRRHRQAMRRCVDDLFACVAEWGGKVHLAKDMVLTRSQFRALFPNGDRFIEIKRELDPEGLFASDLYRRLMVDA
jgi:decaprenylphospho-beta-D-ribofuranose 2-oxidase